MRTLVCILTLALVSTTYAGGTVPFHAAIDTNVAVVGGSPTTLDLVISGNGNGAHVGQLEVVGPSHVDLVANIQTGSSTLSAADGSSFDFSFVGTVVPTGPSPSDPVTFQGTWRVTSGTGRFENATGGGTYNGSAAIPTGVLFMNGVLSNPGRGH
ncbi:MAG TPA: hypothetical protein VFV95_01235 [Vicinamibacterales bacterium]|nr:hypothetical protein [Vicinamibacterales bacterium]